MPVAAVGPQCHEGLPGESRRVSTENPTGAEAGSPDQRPPVHSEILSGLNDGHQLLSAFTLISSRTTCRSSNGNTVSANSW